jgi:predicted phosphate transport protein (TIGR00153 family)
MFRGILPKETNFYVYFESHCELCIELSKELLALANDGADLAASVKKIKDLEHQMDDITHHCLEALHKTFITPIERTDILHLIKRLDDIADAVDSGASRITLYEIDVIRPEVKQLAQILVNATTKILDALKGLRNIKDEQFIKDRCIEIHELENEGDQVLKQALSRLFKEKDAMLVLKWREIYQRFEKAIDRCEDVANVIEGVVIAAS